MPIAPRNFTYVIAILNAVGGLCPMPRFFFDLIDQNGQHHDHAGLELPDLNAAQRVLEMTLPRLSAERSIGGGSSLNLIMIVRDAFDREVMQANLDWTIVTRRIDRDRRAVLAEAVTPHLSIGKASE